MAIAQERIDETLNGLVNHLALHGYAKEAEVLEHALALIGRVIEDAGQGTDIDPRLLAWELGDVKRKYI